MGAVDTLLAAQTQYDAAIVAADYTAAITALMRMRGALIGLPQSELGEFRFEFRNVAAIDTAITDCRKQLAASRSVGSLQFIPVTLQGETNLDAY